MSEEHLPFSTVDLNGNTHKNRFIRDTSYNTTINPSFELEYIWALAYYERYGEPLPGDMDVLYAPLQENVHVKRFFGALVRGLSPIFCGGNIFGKVISGIKCIGGYIFGGNGLLHYHKIAALKQGISDFKQHAGRIRIGDLF